MSAVMEARGVSFAVGRNAEVLHRFDFEVEAGQRVAVMGPSGSGKTTLLALLAGLARPTDGTVYLAGRALTGPATPAMGVATVLQGYGLVGLLTAAENVEIALRAAGHPGATAAGLALEALSRVGLAAQSDQLADDLSGGQQQRVAVARALALEPKVLLADEPTAELDPAARALVMSQLLGVADHGGCLVLATHDPVVAETCDRTISLAKTL